MNIDFVEIDKSRVLNYLNAKDSEQIFNEISKCYDMLKSHCVPKITTLKLDYIPENLIVGEDIKKHLENCFGVLIFCVTLGVQADTLIRKAYYTDVYEQLVLDTTASVLIEQISESYEEELKTSLAKNGVFTTSSYAPGYGDYPLAVLKTYLDMLNSQKTIGVTLTDSGFMLPRKTICAVIGLSKSQVKGFRAGCEHCQMKDNCKIRQGGKTCVR